MHLLGAQRSTRQGNAVFLVQRAAEESIMAGMWELPEIAALQAAADLAPLLRLKHSITVTDYDVLVHAGPQPTA